MNILIPFREDAQVSVFYSPYTLIPNNLIAGDGGEMKTELASAPDFGQFLAVTENITDLFLP